MSLVKCINCEQEYSDVLDACPHCGFKPTLFKCPECGRFCARDDKTCKYCGFPLTPENMDPVSFAEIGQLYDATVAQLQTADENTDYKALEKRFILFGDFRESKERASECRAHYTNKDTAGNSVVIPAEAPEAVQENRNKGISKKTIGIIAAVVIGLGLIGVCVGMNSSSKESTSAGYSYDEVYESANGRDLSGEYSPTYDSVTYDGGSLNGPSPDYSRISLRIDGNRVKLTWYDNNYFGDVYFDSGDQYNVYWDIAPYTMADGVYKDTTFVDESGEIKMILHYTYNGSNVYQNVWFR